MTSKWKLRRLRSAESRHLRSRLRDRSLSVRLFQRYRIVDELRRGRPPHVIADRVDCHVSTVTFWGRRFNASGFKTFERASNPKGRPPILLAGQLRALVDVALSSPVERGLPFTVWSVSKLAAYCRAQGLLPDVTDEWVRRLLRREGLTAQRVRAWKTSHDPDFDRKKTVFAPSTGAVRRARQSFASTNGGRSS